MVMMVKIYLVPHLLESRDSVIRNSKNNIRGTNVFFALRFASDSDPVSSLLINQVFWLVRA